MIVSPFMLKYGAITGFDDNYNLIGETTLNFNQRISLLRDYIECKLPEIRPTTIDTDQYLIDEKARQLGMKKADVACLIDNIEIWNSDDSELPDGYSYDIDSYYLKEDLINTMQIGFNVWQEALKGKETSELYYSFFSFYFYPLIYYFSYFLFFLYILYFLILLF